MRLRRATGLKVLEARKFLQTEPPLLCQRIVQAHEFRLAKAPLRRSLRDPIEDDPATAPIVAQAYLKAEAFVDERFGKDYRRYRDRSVWREVERILRDEHQIVWFSPGRMNPGSTI